MSRHTSSHDQRQGGPDGRRPKPRRRRVVENDDYGAFVRRIIVAYGQRVASGDVEALGPMVRLSEDLDAALRQAVAGLREFGYSWSEIGARLNVTKQSAYERFGR